MSLSTTLRSRVSRSTILALSSVTLVTLFVPVRFAHAGAIVVTECGETVPPGRTAYLVDDLDCRGSGVPGVVLSHRSRLLMTGHAIVGDAGETDAAGAPLQGVRCTTGSVCTVEGPGTITGFSASGVAGTRVEPRQGGVAQTMLVVRDPPQPAVARMKELQPQYPGSEIKVGTCTAS